jgi:hypothetical protein
MCSWITATACTTHAVSVVAGRHIRRVQCAAGAWAVDSPFHHGPRARHVLSPQAAASLLSNRYTAISPALSRQSAMTHSIHSFVRRRWHLGPTEIQKLQHACIDLLALVLKTSLARASDVLALARRATQVTAKAHQPVLREGADLLPLLLHFICTGRASPLSSRTTPLLEIGSESDASEERLSPSFRICMINVLITLAKGIGYPTRAFVPPLTQGKHSASFSFSLSDSLQTVGAAGVRGVAHPAAARVIRRDRHRHRVWPPLPPCGSPAGALTLARTYQPSTTRHST